LNDAVRIFDNDLNTNVLFSMSSEGTPCPIRKIAWKRAGPNFQQLLMKAAAPVIATGAVKAEESHNWLEVMTD
jgi:hypothetical protein